MLLHPLLPLALLAQSVAAKPVARASLSKRQIADSSLLGITQTYTDTATSDPTIGTIPTANKAGLHETLSDISVIAKSSDAIVAQFVQERRVATRLELSTLSYTMGPSGSANIRTVVVTKTYTDVVPCTTTTMTVQLATVEPLPSVSTMLLPSNSLLANSTSVAITMPTVGETCSAVSPPPAAVTDAVVAGCTQWYTAIPGDYCYKIAVQFGVPVTLFMAWNPTINAPWCTNLQAGSAYCVATCEDSGINPAPAVTQSLAVTTVSSPTLPDIPSPTLPSLPSPTLPDIPSPTLPNIPSPTLPSIPSPTLPDIPSPTLPSIPSPTLPNIPSPTLPNIPSPTLPSVSSPTLPTVPTTTSSIALASATQTSSQPAPSGPSGTDVYKTYLGDGSAAAGWPSVDQWVDFNYMFAQNRANMLASCAQWGVPDDSDAELSDMQSSILSVAASSSIDARFILAIIMQESTGCVRVITTAYSHANPGLMQSHNGTGTCNTNMAPLGIPGVPGGGIVQTPCPASEIQQMISDGTEGTIYGDGLVQLFAQQGDSGAQGYYRTARLYNGGSIAASGLLQDGCCTASYVSDVANRLTGWVNAPRTFTG